MSKTSIMFGNSKRGGEPGPVKIKDKYDRKFEESLKSSPNRGSGKEANPGPGSYQIKLSQTTPKFSMAGKPPIPHGTEVPGPGTYKNENFKNAVKSN